MKTALYTAVGILIAAVVTAAGASIIKTEINRTNIERIFDSLERIEQKLDKVLGE